MKKLMLSKTTLSFVTLLLFFLILSIHGLCAGEPGDIIWEKTFSGSDSDRAESLIQTTDGGYAVAGYSYSYGAGGADSWLIKLDNQGNKLWDKIFGVRYNDYAYSLIQTDDGGYAVAGVTGSYGAGSDKFWVIRLDRKGNILWDKTSKYSSYVAYSLIQTTDDGYIVAGYTSTSGTRGDDSWVIKLDRKGNILWEKTFGGMDLDRAESLTQTTDGGYAVAGSTFSYGAGGYDFWVIKLDNRGNKLWDKTFGGRDFDWANSLIQTDDGGYALAGYTNSYGAGGYDFWVIKLDNRGNKLWDKTFGGEDDDVANSLIQTDDGGYALAGYTNSYGTGEDDFWFIKLDHQGNKLWDKTYGGSSSDRANSLIQTTDDCYALAGYTKSYGAGGQDLWVIKIKGDTKTDTRTSNSGTIKITSVPSSAKVFLDAGQYMGKTPLTLDDISPGKHKVTLVLVDYEKYTQDVEVIAGKTINISRTLVSTKLKPPAYGSLRINTVPDKAKVYLDNKYSGTTPLTLNQLKPGDYQLKLSKEGYKDNSIDIEIEANKLTDLVAALTSTKPKAIHFSVGQLVLNSTPSAQVYLNEQIKGTTPSTLSNLEPGTYQLKLTQEGYEPWQQEITIVANQVTRISTNLKKLTLISGSIRITSQPEKAKVYVDETFKGLTPLVLENLEPKSYLIEIKMTGYKKFSDVYEIAGDEKIIIEKSLEIETLLPPDEGENIFTGDNF